MNETFQLIDVDNKGYITAADLLRLGQEVGEHAQHQSMTMISSSEQAERMAAYFSATSSSGTKQEVDDIYGAAGGGCVIDKNAFCKVLSPPEPS